MNTAPTATRADHLLALPDEDFQELVKAEARGEIDTDWKDALRQPGVAERCIRVLAREGQDIQAQLTVRAAELLGIKQECLDDGTDGKAEYFRAKREHDEWRGRAVWALSHINARLGEFKALVKQRNEERFSTGLAKVPDRYAAMKSALRQIAHYPLDVDPEGMGSPEAILVFFQRRASEGLGEAE